MKFKVLFVEASGNSREKTTLADEINRAVESFGSKVEIESVEVNIGELKSESGFGRALVTIKYQAKGKK